MKKQHSQLLKTRQVSQISQRQHLYCSTIQAKALSSEFKVSKAHKGEHVRIIIRKKVP